MSAGPEKFWQRTTLVLLFGLGLGGAPAGWLLVTDPTGAGLGFPPDLLAQSPFRDFTIPGWFLLFGLGLAPLSLAIAVWRHHPSTPVLVIGQGIYLIGWIGLQTYWIGWRSGLQPAMALWGLALLLAGWRLRHPSGW